MGAMAAAPSHPADNEAKGNADAALQGLEAAAESFLQTVRLGTADYRTLGYPLTDQRLTSQQIRLVVQTQTNAPREEISKAVDDIAGGDWKSVAKLFLNSLASFFGGPAPKPSESAVNDVFCMSKLLFENHSIVQYSVFIKRTNCTSLGTLLQTSQATMMTCLCKGNVDYINVDPQTVISCYMASEEFERKVDMEDFFDRLGKELRVTSRLLALKKKIENGQMDEVPGSEDHQDHPDHHSKRVEGMLSPASPVYLQ